MNENELDLPTLMKPTINVADENDLTEITLTCQNLWSRTRKETAGKGTLPKKQDASAAQKQ
jgi:hypothetical protein